MKRILYILSFLLVLASCTPMKMAVSDDLKAGHDEYAVKGRQGNLLKQKLSFGEYQTTKVKRSWTRGSFGRTGIGTGGTAQQEWVNLISLEYVNRKQTVNFGLTDGTNQSDVYCVSRFNAKDLVVGKNPNSIINIALDLGSPSSSTYYVQAFTNAEETPWQLMLDNVASQAKAKSYVGIFARSKTDYYTIHPVTKLEHNGKAGNILAGSVGYEVRDPQGRAVAAVSLIDNGMVFLGKVSPQERFLMANLCSAILLQQQID